MMRLSFVSVFWCSAVLAFKYELKNLCAFQQFKWGLFLEVTVSYQGYSMSTGPAIPADALLLNVMDHFLLNHSSLGTQLSQCRISTFENWPYNSLFLSWRFSPLPGSELLEAGTLMHTFRFLNLQGSSQELAYSLCLTILSHMNKSLTHCGSENFKDLCVHFLVGLW